MAGTTELGSDCYHGNEGTSVIPQCARESGSITAGGVAPAETVGLNLAARGLANLAKHRCRAKEKEDVW